MALRLFREETNHAARLQLKIGCLLLVSVFLVGASGFKFIFGRTFFEGFYFLLITLTTIGYGELPNFSEGERLYTTFLIIIGYSAMAFAATMALRLLVEGEMGRAMEQRRMNRQLTQMQSHIIVCGYGRMGEEIADNLRLAKKQFVVVDNADEAIHRMEGKNIVGILGDATNDDVLIKAGIERAKTLICAATSDADNVFITISARQLNKNLYIISRALDDSVSAKLYQAGANKVILPYKIGGRTISNAAIKPAVVEFMETVSALDQLQIFIEEFPVSATSSMAGKTIYELNLNKQYNIIVVGMQRSDGKMIFNPRSDSRFEVGDLLICMGTEESFEKFLRDFA
ncbi:potassium channel protein [Candidatus Sumerlaeota bacterium]|nr:potassium channel protein [Candidatus Sumerlaeota bacterium]